MASRANRKRRAGSALALAALVALPGCFAFGSRDHDIDHTPIVNAGAGATILMPGQQAPVYHPGGQSWGPPGGHLSYPQQNPAGGAAGPAPVPVPPVGVPGSASGSQSGGGWGAPASQQGSVQSQAPGAGAPAGSVTFIGGAETNEVEHLHYNEEPSWFKYAMLPFAILGAPFQLAAEALEGDPEPGPEVPRATTPMPHGVAPPPVQEAARAQSAPGPAPGPAPGSDYESQRMAELEQQLATAPAPASGVPRASRGSSIAAELDGLRARRDAPAAQLAQARAPAAEARAALPVEGRSPATPMRGGEADGRVDRNGDGRPDQWLERSGGALARELRDDDFDGRAELAIDYDVATGEVRRLEEDQNADATPDSWTDYHGGRPVSQRRDADFDGRVDTWTSFSEGEISRIERDTNADGSPDRSAYYGAGRLVREELDQDRDGRVDVTLRYDDEQRLATREEDSDRDGQIDLISHYESGRLVRRELATEGQAQGGAPPS